IGDDLYRDIVKSGIDVQVELKNIVYDLLKKRQSQTGDYQNSLDFEADKAYFEKSLEEIERGKTKLLDQVSYHQIMDKFKDELKEKYADH
ncbi:MAG: hypothetical protein U9R26_00920, partial [Campylobacterota bacterium]|nr:hypothetical protein [Campylobacterota bacterium]